MRRKFADGFPDLFVDNAIEIRNKHVAFLASFHNPSVIFEQISVIYALPRLFVSSFTLVLPFFPTGTMERVRRGARARGRVSSMWAWPPSVRRVARVRVDDAGRDWPAGGKKVHLTASAGQHRQLKIEPECLSTWPCR